MLRVIRKILTVGNTKHLRGEDMQGFFDDGKKKKNEQLGLKRLRAFTRKAGPNMHCDNCGHDRYSPCGCLLKGGKQKVV